MQVQPYLFFDGRCEEAVDFYRRALGAEVQLLMRYKDSPEPPPPGMVAPGSENKVMHVAMRIGEAVVMASDGSCSGQTRFAGFSLSITVILSVRSALRRYAAVIPEMPAPITMTSLKGSLPKKFILKKS